MVFYIVPYKDIKLQVFNNSDAPYIFYFIMQTE